MITAHLVSIIYNQLIANITLLKPLYFTSLILSTMQLIMGSPLFFSLSTLDLRSTQLTTPFSSIVSLPVSISWVPLTTGLSPISPTGLFKLLPPSYYLHLVVFPKALSYVSPIIASIVSSHSVNQQQYADDTQLLVLFSPSSLSSSLCSHQRCVSSLPSRCIHNGLVLNPSKTEVICFGTSPRLQSLSNLTSMRLQVHLFHW